MFHMFFVTATLFVTYFFYDWEHVVLEENIKKTINLQMMALKYPVDEFYQYIVIFSLILYLFQINQIYWNKLLDKSYCNLNAYNTRKQLKKIEDEM